MGVFLEILKFTDPTGNNMVARIPAEGPADIKSGAQLIVQESQKAVFFRDGKALDTFGPGRHTLTTQNIPVLTKLLSLPFGFQSPFEAFVYYVSTKTFTDLKWGTKEPIVFRDKDLMMVRLRAFGKFSIKISDPRIFVAEIVGTQGYVDTKQVTRYLKDIIVQRLNDLLGETLTSILDLPQHYNEISAGLKAKISDSFGKYGIECTDMVLGAITPPEEVQKMMDRRASMAVLGDMNQYMKFQMAENMGNFASAPGGMAGMGAQLGMGVGMGQMMAGAFGNQVPGQQQGQRPGYPPQGYPPPGYPPQGYPPPQYGYPPPGYPPPQGYPPQGYPPQGYPPQGQPPQGQPPQGRPPQQGAPGQPPQGHPPQGYPPPPGYPPQGYPQQGQPPQGYPPQGQPGQPPPPPGKPPGSEGENK
jgi:membrane protease subunit (stomatin/prohibitin family)